LLGKIKNFSGRNVGGSGSVYKKQIFISVLVVVIVLQLVCGEILDIVLMFMYVNCNLNEEKLSFPISSFQNELTKIQLFCVWILLGEITK